MSDGAYCHYCRKSPCICEESVRERNEGMTEADLFGFKWGNVTVTRVCTHSKHGRWLKVETPKELLEIRVTPSGLIRVERMTRI